jgi:hypothetical protein
LRSYSMHALADPFLKCAVKIEKQSSFGLADPLPLLTPILSTTVMTNGRIRKMGTSSLKLVLVVLHKDMVPPLKREKRREEKRPKL